MIGRSLLGPIGTVGPPKTGDDHTGEATHNGQEEVIEL
jgi:hypothetical protein